MDLHDDALEYHSMGRKGKIEVISSKPVLTSRDLSLAYSPGVAEPCRMIAEKDELVYEYTTKGNLVAVVSNGTAVLGLGDIGPHAAKPVMEGKGILFKKFADIDVFDIELNAKDPEDVIRACVYMEPTFGGINLEDIKAPECFYIEEELKKRLKIPVFHDDQHGTAVISAAAFLNALELVGKKMDEVKVVFSGGGAAAIACAQLYCDLGVKKENVLMADSKGVIYHGRKEGMNPYKERFATNGPQRTLAEAMQGADAFIGVSVKGLVTQAMVKSMNRDPIIFAMANPDPEILPEQVKEVRDDAIMATGRSDYPNQVNNVLGFPFIFRGALDTRATSINQEMKLAAVKALAQLAKEPAHESVARAYGGKRFYFGREYLIPTPFDQRALIWVASAVAEAAMKSGVARRKIDLDRYKEKLESLLGSAYTVMREIKNRVKEYGELNKKLAKLVFPEGENLKILRAAQVLREEGFAEPILLGDAQIIAERIERNGLSQVLKDVVIIDPHKSTHREEFAQRFYEKRQRKGATLRSAKTLMGDPNFFGSMLVEQGLADGLVGGVAQSYPETIRPALQVVGHREGSLLVGIYLIIAKKKVYLFADTTVNIDPSAEVLADIALQTAEVAKTHFNMDPRVALLSFSNFGSVNHPTAQKVRDALDIIREKNPQLMVDGEMHADTAVVPEISEENFPFNKVPGNANILIFPDLQSGNIAYKLISRMGEAEAIGPILSGMKKPVYVLQRGSGINDIANMAALCALRVQQRALRDRST